MKLSAILGGVAAIAIAAPASAAEWDVRVSGYGEYLVGVGINDLDNVNGEQLDGLDTKQDVEIHFRPSITLDNGLQFGANVQLEGNTTGDSIDESFLFVKGDFGEINLGSENSAGYKMQVTAPNVLFIDAADLDYFTPFDGATSFVNVGDDFSRNPMGETQIENDRNNDADRITYYTPRFAGFMLGLSYARDGNQDNNTQVDVSSGSGTLHDIFDVGVQYRRAFGDVSVKASGRWGIATRESGTVGGASTSPQVWGAGLQVGFGGFTIGGSFAEQNESGTEDGIGYDFGISYETGPIGISAMYHHGENVDDEQPFAGADEEIDLFLVGLDYKLAKGVNVNVFGGYASFSEDQGDFGFGGDDISGFSFGSGVKIKF